MWCSMTNSFIISFGGADIHLWDLRQIGEQLIFGELYNEYFPSYRELYSKDASDTSLSDLLNIYQWSQHYAAKKKENKVNYAQQMEFLFIDKHGKKRIFICRSYFTDFGELQVCHFISTMVIKCK